MNSLDHKTLHERVYEALLDLISDGRIAPGDQLDEQALSTRLGVSRTPLRAAIARLAQEGLVVNLPYRGAFVRQFTVEEIDGLYEVRASLEALAARRAAAHRTDAQLEVIRSLLDEAQNALDVGDIEAHSDADARFHRALAEASGNPTLVETLDGLRLRIQLFRHLANHEPGLRERASREREQIVAALEQRDASAAARLLKQHINSVRQTVLRQLTEQAK
jgi:DNA-binding GntR family transcriptional regulator